MNGSSPWNGWQNGRNGDARTSAWSDILRLLRPGVGLKRWALLGAVGVSICSVGIAYVSRRIFDITPPEFLPGQLEGVFFMCAGVVSILLALYGFHRSIAPMILQSGSIGIDDIANAIHTRRSLARGPRIVAIGGGTGMSVLLRGLKAHTDNLTAIVSVGDDGGSSGRLREELDMLPPGDFRNCLVAMSDAEPLVAELFQYRFDQGYGLRGHSFGNLFITAMTKVTNSFDEALLESCRILAVHGRIIPATLDNLRLSVRLANERMIHGESSVSEAESEIDRLLIDPPDAEAHPMAVDAIREAQVIVMGPGSLYTSILPNLLVPGIIDAIRDSFATKVYVCNIATEKGETEGYSVFDHHEALKKHTYNNIVGYVIANSNLVELGTRFYGTPVSHNQRRLRRAQIHLQDLVDDTHPVRHDAEKLADAIMDIYRGRQ